LRRAITDEVSQGIVRNAGRLAFASGTAFLVLLLALHFLEPEFNPSWRMISEYELGSYGWMMRLAFFSMGSYSVFIVISLRRYVHLAAGRVGLAILAIIGIVGAGGSGIFTTDPITAAVSTATGELHLICGFSFILCFPVAVTLIRRGLTSNQEFVLTRRWLTLMTALVWVGVASFLLSFVVFPGKNGLGPTVLIGWPNRFMAVSYTLWIMVIAWLTEHHKEQTQFGGPVLAMDKGSVGRHLRRERNPLKSHLLWLARIPSARDKIRLERVQIQHDSIRMIADLTLCA
jgi:Protein of unknown function (DUF998)